MAGLNFLRLALLATGGAGAAALIYFGVEADRLARIGAGYKAKIACSEIFLAGRNADEVIANEFDGIDPLLDRIPVRVDPETQRTSAAGPIGLGRARAVYREGYGCTLVNAGRLSALPAPQPVGGGDVWPTASDDTLGRIDYAALNRTISGAFANNEVNHRALLVVVDGAIVAEGYAPGFDAQTPLLSWSIAKSVTATLIGAAVNRGLIDVDAPAPEWRGEARAAATWHDLLQMQSGLAFIEHYDVVRSDVNRMLFEMADVGALPAAQKVISAPGERWSYSSGTTNLISKLLRDALAEQGIDYHGFARQAVFNPIGATSMVMEPDARGTFIGSSFVYGTARDWARLGQLYLQGGVWDGTRILPEEWAQYVVEPAAASDGQYGAHFWLNRDGADRPRFSAGPAARRLLHVRP